MGRSASGEQCRQCGGQGQVLVEHRVVGQEMLTRLCPRCAGSGWEPGYAPMGAGCGRALWLILVPLVGLGIVIAIVRSGREDGLEVSATVPTKTVYGYEVGSCVTGLDSEPLDVVPCDQPHQAEVFALRQVDEPFEAERPSSDALRALGQDECQPSFEPYVGATEAASGMQTSTAIPTLESWSLGDRDLACLVLPDDQGTAVTGSVRGSGG